MVNSLSQAQNCQIISTFIIFSRIQQETNFAQITSVTKINKHHIFKYFLLQFNMHSLSSTSSWGRIPAFLPDEQTPATENTLSTDAEVAGIASI